MALTCTKQNKLLTFALVLAALHLTLAGDADILTDFVSYSTDINGSFFTYTGLRSFIGATPPTFTVYKATMAQFPSLNGQSVSFAALYYPPSSVNPPHTHPRASELLFVLEGCLDVGFINTTNHLFRQKLKQGDMFVFPKGLVHYQYNYNEKVPAVALSAFGSASAGTVSIPTTVFNTSIYDPILAASFKTDIETIKSLKNGLSH